MRERRRNQNLLVVVIGITPACAGKTVGDDRPYMRDEDHPRMCGKDGMHNLG